MDQAVASLRRVRPDRFAGFLADLVTAVHDGWEVDCAPPSPEGGVDAVLRRDGERKLVRACQYPESKAVTPGEVRELAALRAAGEFDAATLLATSDVSTDARRAAAATGIEVRDAAETVELARDAGVLVPAPEQPEEGLPRRTATWPDELVSCASDLIEHVESAGRFERRTARTSAYVDADFIPETGGAPVVKVRFGDETLRVYVRYDGRFRRIGTVTESAVTERALAQLERELNASIQRALAE